MDLDLPKKRLIAHVHSTSTVRRKHNKQINTHKSTLNTQSLIILGKNHNELAPTRENLAAGNEPF